MFFFKTNASQKGVHTILANFQNVPEPGAESLYNTCKYIYHAMLAKELNFYQ